MSSADIVGGARTFILVGSDEYADGRCKSPTNLVGHCGFGDCVCGEAGRAVVEHP